MRYQLVPTLRIMTINYQSYTQAIAALLKFVPFIHENLNGILNIIPKYKRYEIEITTKSQQSITIQWEEPSKRKKVDEATRIDAYLLALKFLEQLNPIEQKQITLAENLTAGYFVVKIYNCDIFLSSYKRYYRHTSREFAIARHSLRLKAPQLKPSVDEILKLGGQIISHYNEIELPSELLLFKGKYPHCEYKSSYQNKVNPNSPEPPTRKSHRSSVVGTCLEITSDRKDRFDHDD